jgi:hypothetical protein
VDSADAAAAPEVLGTTVSSPGDARSWIRVRGRDGATRVVMLAWQRGGIAGMATGLRHADPLPLLAEGAGVAAYYDIFTGRLVRVRRDGAGLVVEAVGGALRASRVI